MAWKDAQGQRWNARRPNGWPNDTKAPDGYTVGGFRRIDHKGRIRFAGTYWMHPDMLDHVGRMVRVGWGGIPGNWTDERAQVFWGNAKTNPENYLDYHSEFYETRNSILCDDCGDWNKRPVTK